MDSRIAVWLLTNPVKVSILIVAMALGISYGLAAAGHPSAVWLWRDMLGLL